MNHTLIIAEAGVNHDGDLTKAKKLIDVAKKAGADFVKFQSFRADKLVSPTARKAEYQIRNEQDDDLAQFGMLKRLELSSEDHHELIAYCETVEIQFLSTAFDVEGLDFLDGLGLRVFKSPSGEITNYPYLRKLSELGKPVILSTGMANMDEIKEAVNVLVSGQLSLGDITILHCNTEYPTPMQDVNLLAMKSIEQELKTKVGYSDHTLGIEVPIAAVAMGATVIEKHFTLDRSLPGPDHRASLEPQELTAMVQGIRNIQLSLAGSGVKEPTPSELSNKTIVRKSIHLIRPVQKGQELSEDDLIALRPGDGISPMQWKEVIGQTASRDLEIFHKLEIGDIDRNGGVT